MAQIGPRKRVINTPLPEESTFVPDRIRLNPIPDSDIPIVNPTREPVVVSPSREPVKVG